MSSSVAPGSKVAPAKRSLFNKPAWSKPKATTNTEDFFHRSHQTYIDVAAEQEQKRKKKEARKELGKARLDGSAQREEKRRRVSGPSDNDDNNTSDEDGSTDSERTPAKAKDVESKTNGLKKVPDLPKREPSPVSLSECYEAIATTAEVQGEQKPTPYIIDLEGNSDDSDENDDDDEEELKITNAISIKPMEDDDFLGFDEEFPELAREAREKARRKRLQAKITAISPDPPPSATQEESARRSQSAQQPPPPPAPADPDVSILITSPLPNTKPLIVIRRVSQRLRDVRVTWCQRQNFAPETTAEIFLVWRGRRLFDVTTCRSLGIGVDQDGNILTNGKRDILSAENDKIHMEAMTQEILNDYKKAKRRGLVDKPSEEDAEEPVKEQQQAEPQIKIILKAKGYDDFKLIVKPVQNSSSSAFHSILIT